MLSGLLGLSIAGFVFILYPAWQVSVGYVFIALAVGIVLRDKLAGKVTWAVITTYIASLAVVIFLIGSWWLNAKEAIHVMEQTVYPGQRITNGGGITLSFLLRGFTNISTLHQLTSTLTNQSEIASFYYFLLPLAALFLINVVRRDVTAMESSVALVIMFILLYMFIGIPMELAKYSFWGRVPSNRADLALGLSSIILTFLLLTKDKKPEEATPFLAAIAGFVALLWTYFVYHSIAKLDESISSGIAAGVITAILFSTLFSGYFLIMKKTVPFILLSLTYSGATTLAFNPVNIAPDNLELKSFQPPESEDISLIKKKKVLVMDNPRGATFLAASGTPTVNGTLYYPQKTLWARLDPEKQLSDIYNRYQRLNYMAGDTSPKGFTIGTPFPDIVNITVNLSSFDFRLSGAEIVTAPEHHRAELETNPRLSFINSKEGWSWFNVKGD